MSHVLNPKHNLGSTAFKRILILLSIVTVVMLCSFAFYTWSDIQDSVAYSPINKQNKPEKTHTNVND